MVEPTLIGRLGNFMFEVATAYAYSLKHNMDYTLDRERDIAIGNSYIDRFFPHLEHTKKLPDGHSKWKEPTHAYTEIPYYHNVKIEEYFQSELYFKDYRKEVLELFRFPYEFAKGWTSIHVRRGDYVTFYTNFPPVTEAYLSAAIKLMAANGFKKFRVFSDDIKWCKELFSKSDYSQFEFEYSEGKNEFEDMALMSHCENNIIANSSFSWWGAWLNQNPNKIVVSPSKKNWFGKKSKPSTEDIIPVDWVQIRF